MTKWISKLILGWGALLASAGLLSYAVSQSSPAQSLVPVSKPIPLIPKQMIPVRPNPAALILSMSVNQGGVLRQADERGYVNVNVGETYKLEIYSPNYASAVSVKIDGVSVIERLICDRRVTLDRPINIAKQFIVLEEGNPGLDRDGGVNNPDLGLIEVTFVPIRRKAIALPVMPSRSSEADSSRPSASSQPNENAVDKSSVSASRGVAVGTGLSGSSSQQFVSTNDWEEAPDIASTYTKKYRLVGVSPEPLTLHNMDKPKPLIDPAPPRL
jgi:hypothetical protein